MANNQGPLSGFRDLLSPQMFARQKVIDIIISEYERYGFMPVKTPALEKYETLSGKYGDEATTLMYDFKDRGERHLALRYDHSVPLARLMASMGSSLPLPYKRYAIGDVWRGESPQAGRYREFTQLDADIVGSDSYLADTEILLMMADIFDGLKTKATIYVNDRRILDGLAENSGINEPGQFYKFIGTIDKVAKIGKDQVLTEVDKNFGPGARENLVALFDHELSLDEVAEILKNPKVTSGVANLKAIFDTLKPLGIKNIKFDPTIARGLNYYTSTIFETLIDERPELGSVCSGGRYDKLIGQLGGPDLPAVGTAIGLDRLMDALDDNDIILTKTIAVITNLEQSLDAERLALAHKLRESGLAVELYYAPVKLGKQLGSIDKLGVPLAIIYGHDEHKKGVVLVKDLKNSTQREISLDDLESELSKI